MGRKSQWQTVCIIKEVQPSIVTAQRKAPLCTDTLPACLRLGRGAGGVGGPTFFSASGSF